MMTRKFNLLLSLLGVLVTSSTALAQPAARTVMVQSNNALLLYPTNFWSANAAQARSGLGLGSAATNPASAFQPSSTILSNLAAGGGLQVTNITGTLSVVSGGTGGTNATEARANLGLGSAATNPASAFQPSSMVLSNLATGNGVDLTNITATVVGTNIAISSVTGLQSSLDGKLATNGNGAGLTNLTAANITGTVGLASNVSGVVAITNGGSGATTAAGARTNLGLGSTNSVTFGTILSGGANASFSASLGGGVALGWTGTLDRVTIDSSFSLNTLNLALAFGSNNTTGAAISRTNLGLGWSALTNTTASGFLTSLHGSGTNPVLVNTSGTVVSPTNFWSQSTAVQSFTNLLGSATNNLTNARTLYVYSLTPNVSGITNTLQLPTNALSGDVATIVHTGTTNTRTSVRVAGASTNLVDLSVEGEAVQFIYRNSTWVFAENNSFMEPVFFSGANAAANVSASRTNLGLGWPALTNTNASTSLLGVNTNGQVVYTVTNLLTFTNDVRFSSGHIEIGQGLGFWDGADGTYALFFQGDDPVILNSRWDDDSVRSALGLPLAALTNTNVSNFNTALGLGATNDTTFNSVSVASGSSTNPSVKIGATNFGLSRRAGPDGIVVTVNGATAATIFSNQISANTFQGALSGSVTIGAGQSITFGGGANIAGTRTNLGLGATWLTNTNATNFRTAIGLGATNNVVFNQVSASRIEVFNELFLGDEINVTMDGVARFNTIDFQSTADAAGTRTNLGLGATWLTNTNLTNFNDAIGIFASTESGGRFAIPELFDVPNGSTALSIQDSEVYIDTAAVENFRTALGIPLAALTNTSNVTFQGALFPATNSAPANTTNVAAWINLQVGTNTYKLPLYQ